MKLLLPDLLTGINICLGFVSIILALHAPRGTGTIQHNHIVAAWLILLTGVIDGLDGAIARRIRKTGAFGMEFDSLADLMVFAVVPSTLLYACFYEGRGLFFVTVPLLYLVASAYRLARFNTDAGQAQVKQFVGLPTTVSGTMMVGIILLWADFHRVGILNEVSLAAVGVTTGLAVINSLLMVSTIEFDGLEVFVRRKSQRIILPATAVIILLSIIYFRSPATGLFFLGICYVVESLARWLGQAGSAGK